MRSCIFFPLPPGGGGGGAGGREGAFLSGFATLQIPRALLNHSPSFEGLCLNFGKLMSNHNPSNKLTGYIRSISPRSVQLSPMGNPMGSEQGWGLLADQSESRKFLCPNMERLCAALKSAAMIYMYVQCFAKMLSSVSRLCDNQSLQSHLLGSKNDKEKY